MTIRSLGALAALALLMGSPPLTAQVRFEKRSDAVVIGINGKHFSNLYYGNVQRMPHLHPLRTVSGVAVTRGFPVEPLPGDATDRPNHRGLMFGGERVIGPVSGALSAQLWGWGQNFFDNDPSNAGPDKASIQFQELTRMEGGRDRGTLSMVAHWISSEGKLWIVERRTMTFHAKPAEVRMLDIDVELEAAEPVTFTDYQSSGLAIRLDLPFDDHYGGEARIASGGTNEAGARGRRSPWLDWTATLRNGERVGVAVFDHPKNLNHPTRWQVRAKGFFVANPFAGQVFQAFDPTAATENAAFVMKRGDKLRLRYRVVVHPAERKLDDLLKEFTSQ